MPGLIGKKIGMTSVFSADGKNIHALLSNWSLCFTKIKTVETDSYEAVQLVSQKRRKT